MKVLITCPPMLGLMEEFAADFERRNIELTTPEVKQTLTEQELLKIVPEHDGWIIGDDPATARVFERASSGKLKAAVKWGVGIDNVDMAAAEKVGVAISHTPNMFGDEVGDLAFSYAVSLARDTYQIDRGVRTGEWPKPAGISLRGRRAAVVGYGDVGRAIANRLVNSGMKVQVYDPYAESVDTESVELKTWPDDVHNTSILILACSLTEANRHIINEKILMGFESAVRIVNVARGPLIDEQALARALEAGKVHSAALDVFENEPLPISSALRSFDQVVFGSHNASNTVDAVKRTSEKAISKLMEFLKI